MTVPIELVTAAAAFDDPLYVITIPGEPVPKKRPRFSGRRAYTTREDHDAEARTGWHLAQVIPEPLRGNLAVACVYYRSTRRVVDKDNLAKHVMDAGNGIAWHDDSQCTAEFGVIELDRANPRTVIIIARHQSSLVRK
ncbi:RusA family crossover junction endodeoxyribonuclease [Nocardia sp. NPDC127526]|uniref:RusA family crossover junction endodeoxyribonuclease n=1 Tax=Nocardia sp. NPDC127526 TaxID=3345393 RepID=UPI00362E9C3A